MERHVVVAFIANTAQKSLCVLFQSSMSGDDYNERDSKKRKEIEERVQLAAQINRRAIQTTAKMMSYSAHCQCWH